MAFGDSLQERLQSNQFSGEEKKKRIIRTVGLGAIEVVVVGQMISFLPSGSSSHSRLDLEEDGYVPSD